MTNRTPNPEDRVRFLAGPPGKTMIEKIIHKCKRGHEIIPNDEDILGRARCPYVMKWFTPGIGWINKKCMLLAEPQYTEEKETKNV